MTGSEVGVGDWDGKLQAASKITARPVLINLIIFMGSCAFI